MRRGVMTLANARIARNHTFVARLLGLGTPWMIDGTLEGHLDAARTLRRARARMPVENIDGELRGDFNASDGGPRLSVHLPLLKMP